MSGDVHVQFCERPGVRFPRATHHLRKHAPYLHYDRYLAAGYPIATGVIEGACRYLVRDRMELTGGAPG